MKVFVYVVLLVGLYFSPVTSAVVLDDLYRAERLVVDQGPAAMRRVAADALSEVLVRVSGSRRVLGDAGVREALARADGYVLQYGYGAEEITEDGRVGQQLQLEFDSRALADLLRAAGLPIWSARRPMVLLWLVFDSAKGTTYVSPETTPVLANELIGALAARGVPARFPLFDLEDELKVSAADVSQLNGARLLQAAARYRAPAVFTGRVLQLSAGDLVGDWLYLQNSGEIGLSDQSDSHEGLFDQAVDQIAMSLAGEYAITPRQYFEQGLLLYVDGIEGYAQYAHLVQSLETIEAVSHANVNRVEGDSVLIRLIAEGSLEQLQRAIGLATNLQAFPAGYSIPLDIQGSVNLAYRANSLGGVGQ